MKNYKKIRLAANEGKILPETLAKIRHEWKDCVKDLPGKCFPESHQQGYNKHYYEIMLEDGRVLRFRMDVSFREPLEAMRLTEEKIEEFVNKSLNNE